MEQRAAWWCLSHSARPASPSVCVLLLDSAVSFLLFWSTSQCINTLALDCLLLKTPPKYSNSLQSWLLTSGKPQLCVITFTSMTVRVKLSGKMPLPLYCMKFSFFWSPALLKGCITNIIKPPRTSALTTANHISPAVSMVTVALDCYCSNSTTGNSLQPWSLGGKKHIWARPVQKGCWEKWPEKCQNDGSSVVLRRKIEQLMWRIYLRTQNIHLHSVAKKKYMMYYAKPKDPSCTQWTPWTRPSLGSQK